MNKIFKIGIEIFMLCMIIGVSFTIGAIKGDSIQQKFITSTLITNFYEKNGTLVDEKTITGRYVSDYDFETYNNYFQKNYKYDLKTFDCKVSSLNWINYLDKHNYEYKIITTDNHMFVMSYNEDGYCILDLNYSMCRGMILR